MFASGALELIWHFAGYLRVPDFDFTTPTIRYDGNPAAGPPADINEAPPHTVRIISESYLPQVHLGHFNLLESDSKPWHLPRHQVHAQLTQPHEHLPHMHGHHDLHPQTAIGFPGTESSFQLTVTATYQPGGNGELIDVRQVNVMTNNNILDDHNINAPANVVFWNQELAALKLGHLLDQAGTAPGHDLLPVGATTAQLISFANANDASASHPNYAPYEVHAGQYVNGQLVTDGSNPHQVTNDALQTVVSALNNGFAGPPALPTGDGQDLSHQTVTVGGDSTTNEAVLANFDGGTVGLAVLGNYYQLQAIVQTNVFQESDHVGGPTSYLSNISVASNTVQNIGDISEQAPTLTSGGTVSVVDGLSWNVTVLNGSLYDVHSLVQTNYLTNNNVVYESTSIGISKVLAGGDTLANTASFETMSANYDLIIVEGNYHQENLISQTNVMLDSNNVHFSGDGTATQNFTGGGNTLINDAAIVNIGNYSFQALDSNAMSVIQSLAHEQNTLSPTEIANGLPGMLGNLNVLFVTGDYYDINYISQTNIMSNANTVNMSGSTNGLPGGALQTVQTGSDMAINAATIYDAGSALSPWLGGQYSNDMIIIQTNIVTNDASKVVSQDPNQLASELVAFTGPTETAPQQQTTVATPLDQHHGSSDVMASILH